MGVMAGAIEKGIDGDKVYEVTARMAVSAESIGDAVKRAAMLLPDGAVIADVRPAEY